MNAESMDPNTQVRGKVGTDEDVSGILDHVGARQDIGHST